MKVLLLTSLISLFCISSFAQDKLIETGDQSIYETLINKFEEPSVSLASFEELYGSYVGRCFTFDNPNDSSAALLVVSKKQISDNGPLFPPSFERKAVLSWGLQESDRYDGKKSLSRNNQFMVAANWDDHSTLKQLGDSWEYEIKLAGLVVYLKQTSIGLTAMSYVTEGGSILNEDQEKDFSSTSYKRVYHSCYFFEKFPAVDIKDPSEYNPF